jgi:hypothetical protein
VTDTIYHVFLSHSRNDPMATADLYAVTDDFFDRNSGLGHSALKLGDGRRDVRAKDGPSIREKLDLEAALKEGIKRLRSFRERVGYSAGIGGCRSAAELWAYVCQVGWYAPAACLPHTLQPGRTPRANSSRNGPRLHASMIS